MFSTACQIQSQYHLLIIVLYFVVNILTITHKRAIILLPEYGQYIGFINMKKYIVYALKGIIFAVLVVVYQCPFRLIFKIECPGCGLTAAILSAIKLDFKSAFNYHPLFLIPVIVVIYLLFRKKFSLPQKLEVAIGIFFIVLFIVNYALKLLELY